MAPSEDGFRTILTAFKKRLTPKEEEDFQFATLQDVHNAINRIQKEQAARYEMMNMARIQSFLEGMDQFGKVIEVFLNTSEFVAFVWGPLKFVLQVASTWAESFDTLLDAYEQIGNQIPLLQQFQTLFDRNQYMRRVLEMIYSDILEFHKRAIRFFSNRVWRQVFRSVWKDFKTRFQHILDGLRRHRELIESQANLLHIQQYQHDRSNMLDALNRMEAAELQKKYVAVMEWVSGAQPKLDHDSACEARSEFPESGSWVLKKPELEDWKEAEIPMKSVLWLNGIPGAGKTILASVIIEKCLNVAIFTTSFFYCKYNDPQKDNWRSILKGLLSQTICQCRHLVPFFHDKYLARGELTLTSTSLAEQLLDLSCQEIQKQYIIIDGLDECEASERKRVLSFFNSRVERYDSKDPGKVRVLFVSQGYDDIANALTTASVITLGPDDNESDIRSFVHRSTVNIQQKHELDSQNVEFIKRSTCARAKGMFLFAKLVMSNLFAQPTRRQCLEELQGTRFPAGLGEAYERIMHRIANNQNTAEWDIARKLLGWMVCARRPLKWPEIQGASSIDLVGQTVNFDERKLRVHIRDLCGSLIQVSPGDRVELVHSTAKFYITDTGYVRTPIVECDLTALCLQYLTFECFDQDISQEKLIKLATEGYFAFQDYAVANWSYHFRAMVEAGQHLFARDMDTVNAIQELEVALNDFADRYEEDDDVFQEEVVSSSDKMCEAFKQFGFYDSLEKLWSHVCRYQKGGSEAWNDVSLKSLGDALLRNRKLVEDLMTSANRSFSIEKRLDSFYGGKRYKCPKLTCFYFHEGFADAKSRDVHVNRHDRPFQCTFPDCSVGNLGFGSSKELERHKKSYHPELNEEAVTFTKATTVTTEGQFACHLCDKRFSRNLHLRSHLLNHNGERPFACSTCEKAFTRANDCKRHEKIHARR